MVQNEFLGAITTCQEGKLCFTSGDMVVASFGLGHPGFWYCLASNACLGVGFLVIAMFVYEKTSRPQLNLN
jgi:hypothetical protein